MAPRRTAHRGGSLLDAERLAARVLAKRRSQSLNQREAAAAIGVSASTLSRIERGRHLPHREPLLKIAQWLDVPIELADGQPFAGQRVNPSSLSTVETVELAFRADPDLSPADAHALIETVHLLYGRLRRREPPGQLADRPNG